MKTKFIALIRFQEAIRTVLQLNLDEVTRSNLESLLNDITKRLNKILENRITL